MASFDFSKKYIGVLRIFVNKNIHTSLSWVDVDLKKVAQKLKLNSVETEFSGFSPISAKT